MSVPCLFRGRKKKIQQVLELRPLGKKKGRGGVRDAKSVVMVTAV